VVVVAVVVVLEVAIGRGKGRRGKSYNEDDDRIVERITIEMTTRRRKTAATTHDATTYHNR
jgi:hypothetical protein